MKKYPYQGRETTYTTEQDNLIFSTIHNRPTGLTMREALKSLITTIHRDSKSIENRYYHLKRQSDKAIQGLVKDVFELPKPNFYDGSYGSSGFGLIPFAPAVLSEEGAKNLALALVPDLTKVEISVTKIDDFIASIEVIKQEMIKIVAERDRLKTDLSTANNRITYQKKRIAELEEDQQSFLRLMDKARAIGTREVQSN